MLCTRVLAQRGMQFAVCSLAVPHLVRYSGLSLHLHADQLSWRVPRQPRLLLRDVGPV